MKLCQMSGKKNQTIICKPLGYKQANLQKHLQFTRTFTMGFYKNEVQFKIRMQVKMSKLSSKKE
jgi:hypothetical protein